MNNRRRRIKKKHTHTLTTLLIVDTEIFTREELLSEQTKLCIPSSLPKTDIIIGHRPYHRPCLNYE